MWRSRCQGHLATAARRYAVAPVATTTTVSRASCLVSARLRSSALPTQTVPSAFSARQRPYSTSAEPSPEPSSPPALEKPDFLDDAESKIWDLLVAEFAPAQLSVQDVSGGCGSMYGIEIASERFRGVNMLKQQRMVNQALGDQIKGWHGVQLRTRVPPA